MPHRSPCSKKAHGIRAAKLDAYRGLAEQVYGQYLDASRQSLRWLEIDSFRSKVEGGDGATLVSISPRAANTYEVTLSLDKALVQDLRALCVQSSAVRRG